MRRNRGQALGRFFDDLGNGDPVALGMVGALLAVAGVIGFFVLKARRDMKREDEGRAKRYGRPK